MFNKLNFIYVLTLQDRFMTAFTHFPDSGVSVLGPYGVTNSSTLPFFFLLEWAHFLELSGPGGIPHKLAHRPHAICYH